MKKTISNSCLIEAQAEGHSKDKHKKMKRKYDKCNFYIKNLIDLINEKKTCIFDKKSYTKNFN